MLIPVIEFDLRNPIDNSDERFVVENTEDNFELIARNKLTHNILFSQMFDFQFERETEPKFIRFGNAAFQALDYCLDNNSDGVDYGDQMA